jgi:hypothetical protein
MGGLIGSGRNGEAVAMGGLIAYWVALFRQVGREPGAMGGLIAYRVQW